MSKKFDAAKARLVTNVTFKSYPWFMDQMRSGLMTFNFRRHDLTDERIYALAWGSANHQPDVETVTFVNTDDPHDTLTFEYRGMEFTPWSQGWCMLLLGKRDRKAEGAIRKVLGLPPLPPLVDVASLDEEEDP